MGEWCRVLLGVPERYREFPPGKLEWPALSVAVLVDAAMVLADRRFARERLMALQEA